MIKHNALIGLISQPTCHILLVRERSEVQLTLKGRGLYKDIDAKGGNHKGHPKMCLPCVYSQRNFSLLTSFIEISISTITMSHRHYFIFPFLQSPHPFNQKVLDFISKHLINLSPSPTSNPTTFVQAATSHMTVLPSTCPSSSQSRTRNVKVVLL